MTTPEVKRKPGRPAGSTYERIKEIKFAPCNINEIQIIQRVFDDSVFKPLVEAARRLKPAPNGIRIQVPDNRNFKQFRSSISVALLKAKKDLPEGETFRVGVSIDRKELVIRRGKAKVMPEGWKPGRKKGSLNKVTDELDDTGESETEIEDPELEDPKLEEYDNELNETEVEDSETADTDDDF